MYEELLKRAEDLSARCARRNTVTSTTFLTPAEQHALRQWAAGRDCVMLLHGGVARVERAAAFFLPDYLAPEDFDPSEYFRAVRVTAHFGAPGHRDYLGALLALGVRREWVGDLLVDGSTAHVLCLPSVERHLLTLEKVGRCGVKCEPVPLDAVPSPERKTKAVTFTVQSLRLDAALAGLFHLSRTTAAARIRAGDASLNYEECLRPDATVRAGDVLSLRGYGKGAITETGGQSRKGRLFISGEVWI